MTDKDDVKELEELRAEGSITTETLMKKHGLPFKRALFVQEYIIDLNQTQAALRAGYSERTAYAIGHELLKKPKVIEALKDCMDARSKRTAITADDVLQRIWMIAGASASELTQMRTGACRNCWGAGHRYQFVDEKEEMDYAQYCLDKEMPVPDTGGVGYKRDRVPHPDCPQCSGEGVSRMWVADTRTLSPQAVALFDGVKKTKDGIEIKTKDSLAALKLAGQHLGMFTNKVEVTGKDGGAIRHEYTPDDYVKANSALQEALSASRNGTNDNEK